MSKTTEDLGSVIGKLEDIKSELETHNSENNRCMSFIQEFMDNLFTTDVSYTHRLEIANFFEKFTYITRDGDDSCGYYGFNIMDKRKFRTLCDELRKELGLEKDE